MATDGERPYDVVKDHPECPSSKPYGVVKEDNPGGKPLGCHPTSKDAYAQISAIEEEEGASMATNEEGAWQERTQERIHMDELKTRLTPDFYTRAEPDFSRASAEELLEDPSLPVPFVASTEGVKSDGLDLKMEQWDLRRFSRYGPILWVHNYFHPPLGTGRAKKGEKLYVDVRYDEDDPFAMQIRSKAIKGMMAGSVGWRTYEGEEMPMNELIEFSMTPVGLDPEALPDIQRTYIRSILGFDGTENNEETLSAISEWMKELREDVMKDLREIMEAYLSEDEEETPEEPDPDDEERSEGDEPSVYEIVDQKIQEFRQAFLEDMAEQIDEEIVNKNGDGTGLRAGAVLSRKNREDLESARDLISRVLERASKENDEPEGDPEEMSDPGEGQGGRIEPEEDEPEEGRVEDTEEGDIVSRIGNYVYKEKV